MHVAGLEIAIAELLLADAHVRAIVAVAAPPLYDWDGRSIDAVDGHGRVTSSHETPPRRTISDHQGSNSSAERNRKIAADATASPRRLNLLMARMTPAEANAVNVVCSYLAGQDDVPDSVAIALEVLANRAHNRIQTGWDENAVRAQWPKAFASQSQHTARHAVANPPE